jgi:PBP1b-binding outer membrane lipoprotein LpoB
MKQNMKFSVAFLAAAITLASCTKEVNEVESISDETLSQIAALGFSTKDVQKIDEGYLVEGDIILTDQKLKRNSPAIKS